MTAPEQSTVSSHVLLIEDEPQLARTLAMNLRGRGYAVTAVGTGSAALEASGSIHPDLVVLDLGLPDMDGLEVIRRFRERADNVPIVVLSARSASAEKVAALDLGANDYVTKPFDIGELAARLRAVARRGYGQPPTAVVTLGTVEVDLTARTVRRRDGHGAEEHDSVRLTPNEWRMLEVLLRRPGQLITPLELLAAMRPGDPARTADSYLRIYMQQLRRKLEADPTRPRHLLTEPGLGYRFKP